MNISKLNKSLDTLIDNLLRSSHSPAILLVDFQWDFITGSLAVPGGQELVDSIQLFLEHIETKFKIPIIATGDSHPKTSQTFSVNMHDKLIDAGYIPHYLPSEKSNPKTKFDVLNTIIEWTPEDYPKQKFFTWPEHCIENTPGAELAIKKSVNHTYLTKGHDIEEYSIVGSFESPLNPIRRFNQRFLELIKDIDTFLVFGLATDFCVKETMLDLIKLGKDVLFIAELSRGIMPHATEQVCEQLEKLADLDAHGKFSIIL